MTPPFPLPISVGPLPWLFGAGVAFVVGLIAFALASRLLHEHDQRRGGRPRGTARLGH